MSKFDYLVILQLITEREAVRHYVNKKPKGLNSSESQLQVRTKLPIC